MPTLSFAGDQTNGKILCNTQPRDTSSGTSTALPKIVWIFWGQGLEQAPDLVKHCVASWRKMNPSWDVRIWAEATAEPLLRKAAIPWERLDTFPLVNKSNILRLRLLTEHGGVWADATTFCLQPLDEWLPDCMRAGFFCFRDPGADRLVANWFLASDRDDRLAILWRDAHEAFWNDRDYLHHNSYDGNSAALPPVQRHLLRALHAVLDRNTRRTDLWFHPVVRFLLRTYPYCVMHYLFAHGCRRNRQWQELFSQMPYREAKPLLASYTLVREGKSFAEILEAGREQALPMLKFNWKSPPAGLSHASP